MDELSSPVSVTSSSTAARIPTPRQPTYTTAGTIYNPKSSQNLQPPIRRGRSFKWPNGGSYTYADLALLPKAALAALPYRSTSYQSVPVSHQYSPLQQNYDRAVSPGIVKVIDHHQTSMMAGLSPPPDKDTPQELLPSLLVGSSEDKSDKDDESEESSSDSDFGTDPLAAMTVKSLQNLASYPNPNQKRARKALMGAKSSVQLTVPATRAHSPPKPALIRPIGSPPKPDNSGSRAPVAETPSFGLSQKLGVGLAAQHDTGSNVPTIYPSPAASGTAQQSHQGDTNASSATMTPGPGAPRPLTAGPPGQRQYRPSTFESTFKALQSKNQQENGLSAEDGYGMSMTPGVQAWSEKAQRQGVWSVGRSSVGQVAGPPRNSVTDQTYMSLHGERAPGFILGDELAQPGPVTIDNGRNEVGNVPGDSWMPTGHDVGHEDRPKNKPGTDHLSDAQLTARNNKIDRWWYSGSTMLSKRSTNTTGTETAFSRLDKELGAIGDGRPMKSAESRRLMSIPEAAQMAPSEHAAPLLDIALASLERYGADQLSKMQEYGASKQARNG